MKVIDIARILEKDVNEIKKIVNNASFGTNCTDDTEVKADIEKRIAKYYGVGYPFKSKNTPKVEKKKNESFNANSGTGKTEQKNETKKAEPAVKVENKPATKNNDNKKVENKETKTNNQEKSPKKETKVNKETPKKETPKEVKVELSDEEREKNFVDVDLDHDNELDDAIDNKYGEYYEDDHYEGGHNQRIKQQTRTNDPKNKHKKNGPKVNKSRAEKLAGNVKVEKEANVIYFENNITVLDVAEQLNISVTDLVKKLFASMGVFASATQSLDRDTVELIAMEYNFTVKDKQVIDLIHFDEMNIVDDEENLELRPAIVTIMGHVDHGKTTLLDTIRNSHVTQGEAGGITQHIGAYQVLKNGKLITFIDTPGHAAFTEMRARGAQVTDIVILVVAADDGVMPQTKEAIEHAQAANVPIIVAVNKMDKPGTNPDKIKQELTNYNLLAEDWGGDTIFVPISAKTGMGVDDLLEMVILVSEMRELKANPNRLATGTVIEAKLDKGRGPVATLLVQNGTLKVGDLIVVGTTYGKIRAMQDEYGKIVKAAGPAKPVEVTGLAEVPNAGEKFMALDDEKKAKAIAEIRTQNKFNEDINSQHMASLSDLANSDDELKTLNLIIKCDVQGSIEAIRGLLQKINIEGTKINIISTRVGGITDNDISLAIASRAIIIGFNIRPTSQISDLAKEKNIEIRLYNIIYKLQEDIEKAVKGLLDPVFEEVITGVAEVRETFKISKIGTVAGSMVTRGEIKRSGSVRVIRDSIVVYQGRIAGLRRFKDDVKEVKEGFDCGITVENFNDIKVGDTLECFVMEEQERD